MNDLIDDILALAVTDAAEIALVRQRFDLGAVARRAVSIGAVAAERKRVRLALDARTVWAEGDPLKLEQVLNNLINNAIKFSKEDDVVTVAADMAGGTARLSVADHGTGIPDAVRVNLFKPFAKGETGTAGERSNGLGLYICSRVIEAHGGSIGVESVKGQGTTFTVSLPAIGAGE